MNFNAFESHQSYISIRNDSAQLKNEQGFDPIIPPELIDFLLPQVALLSVAGGDKTRLPSPKTLDTLEGYSLSRINVIGWIKNATYGSQMWVEVERR